MPSVSSDAPLLDPKNDYVFKRLFAQRIDLLTDLVSLVRGEAELEVQLELNFLELPKLKNRSRPPIYKNQPAKKNTTVPAAKTASKLRQSHQAKIPASPAIHRGLSRPNASSPTGAKNCGAMTAASAAIGAYRRPITSQLGS